MVWVTADFLLGDDCGEIRERKPRITRIYADHRCETDPVRARGKASREGARLLRRFEGEEKGHAKAQRAQRISRCAFVLKSFAVFASWRDSKCLSASPWRAPLAAPIRWMFGFRDFRAFRGSSLGAAALGLRVDELSRSSDANGECLGPFLRPGNSTPPMTF
jgi:hypothetical protein